MQPVRSLSNLNQMYQVLFNKIIYLKLILVEICNLTWAYFMGGVPPPLGPVVEAGIQQVN